MEEFILFQLILEKKKEEEVTARKRHLRSLRDTQDPFSLDDDLFRKPFVFPKTLCQDLIAELKEHEDATKSSTLPFELRFLSVLYAFANVSKQKSNPLNMSQSSISRNINFITRLLLKVKHSEIGFPKTNEQYNAIKTGFQKSFGMKGVIGALGCTHISIITPAKIGPTAVSQETYVNENGQYSIKVQGICNHNLEFLYLDASSPGSCNDAEIWKESEPRKKLLKEHRAGDCKFLLGDSNYPTEPWLLTPLTDARRSEEVRYNEKHAAARGTIEKAFSVLKARFKLLSGERPLFYAHKPAATIIYACAILHNILQKNHVFLEEEEENFTLDIPSEVDTENNYCTEGMRIRNAYISKML